VLAARHDVRRACTGCAWRASWAEIRKPDLRFTVAEASELFAAAGVDLPEVAPLVERTEGWAAGLRLAALWLAGHPDPGRLAAGFSGTERTVAEYLLAEVLDRLGPGRAAARRPVAGAVSGRAGRRHPRAARRVPRRAARGGCGADGGGRGG
jgi:LuxR family transcriptional regulator, maltose regulon positive regulatory protein